MRHAIFLAIFTLDILIKRVKTECHFNKNKKTEHALTNLSHLTSQTFFFKITFFFTKKFDCLMFNSFFWYKNFIFIRGNAKKLIKFFFADQGMSFYWKTIKLYPSLQRPYCKINIKKWSFIYCGAHTHFLNIFSHLPTRFIAKLLRINLKWLELYLIRKNQKHHKVSATSHSYWIHNFFEGCF